MSELFRSKEEVAAWLDAFDVRGYSINEDLSVDVAGDVFLGHKSIKKLPVQFGIVSGGFHCSNNQLESLDGAPREVGRDFDCSNNQLTTLEGGPRRVGGYYRCDINQLSSLIGIPEAVGDYFACSNNPGLGEIQKSLSWESIKTLGLKQKYEKDLKESDMRKPVGKI